MNRNLRPGLGVGVDRAVRLTLLCLLGPVFMWFFLPLPLYGVLNVGNLTGMAGIGFGMAAVLYADRLTAFLRRRTRTRAGKGLFVVLGGLLLACACFAGVFSVRILAAASRTPEGSPTAVVLGCQVYGEKPSLLMIRRVEAARAYLESHPDAVCVLSGGQGPDEDITEAACMYGMLTGAGIDPARLYQETESTSTEENLAFSMALIRERGLPDQIATVTNEFHQYRASLFAEAAGAARVYAVSAPSPLILLPTYVVREWFGVAAALLRPARVG